MPDLIALPPTRLAPVHLRRDATRQLIPSTQEALDIIHQHVIPQAKAFAELFKLPYVEHVFESSSSGDWENIVIPELTYQKHKRYFAAAGFLVAPDTRQFATADGLEEALRHGSNFNKRWD